MKEIKKTIFILFFGLIGISFYSSTFEKNIRKQIKKVFGTEAYEVIAMDNFEILSFSNTELFRVQEADSMLGYFAITEASGCAVGGCRIDNRNTSFEKFFMLTVFDFNAKIKKVKILEYDSEYGYEIMAPGWLRQFEKNKKEKLIYNQDIDGITGATKSANSVVNEINVVSKYVREITK